MLRAAVLAFSVLAAAPQVSAAPSFDCAKAQSASENAICKSQDLQWFDRQLARLYKLARDPIAADGKTLLTDQREFLTRRDGCGENFGCIWRAYEERLVEVARWVDLYEPYAKYERPRAEMEGAGFWIVRFGSDAAVKIWAAKEGSYCAFETDNASVGGKGVVRASREACRIVIVPDGEDLRVETNSCQRYCGPNAVMDGPYTNVAPR